ncbi:MAG: c-type cytochrome biogenesis protein CcmI [Geminicoccaceae bacterium]
MMHLVLFLLLSAVAIILLALPFLRRQGSADRDAFDLAVYQDQLDELDRDHERGLIDAEATRAAKLEIERRILTLAPTSAQTQSQPSAGGSGGSWVTVGLVVVVPLASALLYVSLGTPDMQDLPLASRPAPQPSSEQDALLANIEQLEQHLETTPDNGGVWMVLGRNRLRAGLYPEAIEAFTKGIEFTEDDPTAPSELAEAMVYAAGGQVTPGALQQFRAVLETVPNEPRARYYLGLALAQEGEMDAAIDGWSQLLAVSPSDAPWRPQIIDAVKSVLAAEGRPADEIIASLPKGTAPAAGDAPAEVANPSPAAAASGGDQDEMIRGMVEGLAARLENEPDDVEGWLMLGRSRLVLEEPELAKAAFERAKKLAPENPDVLIGYAASLLQPSETPGGDPVVGEEAVAIYQKVVELAPDDPEPRWLLGLAAAQAGDKEQALGHWQDLLGLLDEGAEDKTVVEARIAALESDEPAATAAAGAPSIAPGGTNGAPVAGGKATTSGAAAAGDAVTTTSTETPPPSQASPGPGPTEEDMETMAAMSPEERSTQIRGMVEGLAARLEDDPSDIEGWLRLAQSRIVLGEPEAAAEAYRRAMEQAPEDTEVLRAYAASLLGERHPETDVPTVGEQAADLYRKIIDLEPDDPEAHWYLGLAAVQDGATDDAKSHWQQVLDVLGPDHPNYAAVQSSLQQVETKTQ